MMCRPACMYKYINEQTHKNTLVECNPSSNRHFTQPRIMAKLCLNRVKSLKRHTFQCDASCIEMPCRVVCEENTTMLHTRIHRCESSKKGSRVMYIYEATPKRSRAHTFEWEWEKNYTNPEKERLNHSKSSTSAILFVWFVAYLIGFEYMF